MQFNDLIIFIYKQTAQNQKAKIEKHTREQANTDSNIQGILMGNQKRQEKNNVWSVKQNHNRKGGNHKIKHGKKLK